MNSAHRGSVVFYREQHFNPVPIGVEEATVWDDHFAKRRNLYERHLGIPLSLLQGRSICEIGCNSGENALVLASVGADLTLVEPNEQVLSRLRTLFASFGLNERITELVEEDIASFTPRKLYDMVIAEGFLFTLPNRDELLEKICNLMAPGGLGVISFIDRFGALLEMTKRLLVWRGCQLTGIDNLLGDEALELAKQLFYEDFSRINVSRQFEVWCKDTLISPFATGSCLWSYAEISPQYERLGCEFYSSSPKWDMVDHYTWYKNIRSVNSRREGLMADWSRAFPYFCTGLKPSSDSGQEAPPEVVQAVAHLVADISEYSLDYALPIDAVTYPPVLSQYFSEQGDPRLRQFSAELEHLYEAAIVGDWDHLLSTYRASPLLRDQWGTPCQYLCFTKTLSAGTER